MVDTSEAAPLNSAETGGGGTPETGGDLGPTPGLKPGLTLAHSVLCLLLGTQQHGSGGDGHG